MANRTLVDPEVTKEEVVLVAEQVLTMRESTAPEIAKVIAATVVQRSLHIRDVVKFRRAMQAQTEEVLNRVERLLGQNRISVFQRASGG